MLKERAGLHRNAQKCANPHRFRGSMLLNLFRINKSTQRGLDTPSPSPHKTILEYLSVISSYFLNKACYTFIRSIVPAGIHPSRPHHPTIRLGGKNYGNHSLGPIS
jgi:hypothetical protein